MEFLNRGGPLFSQINSHHSLTLWVFFSRKKAFRNQGCQWSVIAQKGIPQFRSLISIKPIVVSNTDRVKLLATPMAPMIRQICRAYLHFPYFSATMSLWEPPFSVILIPIITYLSWRHCFGPCIRRWPNWCSKLLIHTVRAGIQTLLEWLLLPLSFMLGSWCQKFAPPLSEKLLSGSLICLLAVSFPPSISY